MLDIIKPPDEHSGCLEIETKSVLLAMFAKRVVSGEATDEECKFMVEFARTKGFQMREEDWHKTVSRVFWFLALEQTGEAI